MLTIEKTVLPSPEQWEIIIEGARNPLNSWDLMDSFVCHGDTAADICPEQCPYDMNTCPVYDDDEYIIGPKDHKLLSKLANAGPDEAKFRRMVPVYITINAPLYWWKEFDTYKIATVANSCSTMHKIHDKEFVYSDFSHEDLLGDNDEGAPLILNPADTFSVLSPESIFVLTVRMLNAARVKYLEFDRILKNPIKVKSMPDDEHKKLVKCRKAAWKQMIQLLPTSYNQKRTIFLNYEVLANMYHARRNHKLGCWHTLCDWIETLPYSEFITGKGASNK